MQGISALLIYSGAPFFLMLIPSTRRALLLAALLFAVCFAGASWWIAHTWVTSRPYYAASFYLFAAAVGAVTGFVTCWIRLRLTGRARKRALRAGLLVALLIPVATIYTIAELSV